MPVTNTQYNGTSYGGSSASQPIRGRSSKGNPEYTVHRNTNTFKGREVDFFEVHHPALLHPNESRCGVIGKSLNHLAPVIGCAASCCVYAINPGNYLLGDNDNSDNTASLVLNHTVSILLGIGCSLVVRALGVTIDMFSCVRNGTFNPLAGTVMPEHRDFIESLKRHDFNDLIPRVLEREYYGIIEEGIQKEIAEDIKKYRENIQFLSKQALEELQKSLCEKISSKILDMIQSIDCYLIFCKSLKENDDFLYAVNRGEAKQKYEEALNRFRKSKIEKLAKINLTISFKAGLHEYFSENYRKILLNTFKRMEGLKSLEVKRGFSSLYKMVRTKNYRSDKPPVVPEIKVPGIKSPDIKTGKPVGKTHKDVEPTKNIDKALIQCVYFILCRMDKEDHNEYSFIKEQFENDENKNKLKLLLRKLGFKNEIFNEMLESLIYRDSLPEYLKVNEATIDKYLREAGYSELSTTKDVDQAVKDILSCIPKTKMTKEQIRLYLISKYMYGNSSEFEQNSFHLGGKIKTKRSPAFCKPLTEDRVVSNDPVITLFVQGGDQVKINSLERYFGGTQELEACIRKINNKLTSGESMNGRWTTNIFLMDNGTRFPVYHVSSGIPKTAKNCTLFFLVNGQSIEILGAGKHKNSSTVYSILWKSDVFDVRSPHDISTKPMKMLTRR